MKIKATTKDAYKLLHQGTLALSQVERNGIRIDVKYLQHAIDKTKQMIRRMESDLKTDPECKEVYKAWRKHYGEKMNINSGDQLGEVLFTVLKYKCKQRTKTGKPQTDIAALERLDIPYVQKHLAIKKLKKARGTYLKGILRETVDGILHPNFNLNLARTMRSSSDNPNFQNMPIRIPEMSKIIRPCFIPRKGRVLIEKDYGRLEVCIAACYNRDPRLIDYIKDSTKDMHRDMAQELFIIDKPGDVDKKVRHVSKNSFVFPEFYGSWYVQVCKGLWDACTIDNLEVNGVPMHKHLKRHGIDRRGYCNGKGSPLPGTFEAHVKKVEDRFWNKRFKKYKQWKEKWWEAYLKDQSFDTLTGFHFEGVMARNDVINYPIQGSAFHCLLWSLINGLKEIRKHKMKTLIVGQIHDSIISDTPKSEATDYLDMMEELMTETIRKVWKWIIIPLEIEAEASAKNWYKKKEWTRQDGIWKPKEAA